MDTKQIAIQILRNLNNHSPRSYSGRGMSGQSCFAVTTDSLPSLMEDIFEQLESEISCQSDEVNDYSAATKYLLSSFTTDSMGYDTVVYWKRLQWDGKDEDED